MSRTLWEANTGFSKDFMEGYLCKDGKPISLSSYYKGDDNMRNRNGRSGSPFETNCSDLGFSDSCNRVNK